MDDGEAFRQAVKAFIAKRQTWFHYESLIIARSPWGIKWPYPYPLIRNSLQGIGDWAHCHL